LIRIFFTSFKNSIKFSNWILKDKTQSPNFFDAQRVHFIINKMIIKRSKIAPQEQEHKNMKGI